ncbi:MAG: hypothetical protein KAJ62_12835, partial [Desulfobacteraceae bacterium]|nr:hypothetical protein [Desulfobacteraceae bacterium]
TYDDAYAMMSGAVKAIKMVSDDIIKVACGYADYNKFGGVPCMDIVKAAKDSGCDVAMLDTAVKDGSNLFDALSMQELADFIGTAKEHGMKTALAGSIKKDHMDKVFEIDPDIIGVRGAVCEGNDRTSGITEKGVREFIESVRK